MREEGIPLRIALCGSYNVVMGWDDLVEMTEQTLALESVRLSRSPVL
jgi:hypothetical protein